jgi:signal transduction protein with GAF and PtsI domain
MTTSYPVDLRALSALIEVIYKCALDPAGWRIALWQICEAIDTDTAALYLVDFHQREPRLYAQWGMPEEKAAEWQTRFGADGSPTSRDCGALGFVP